MPLYTFFPTRPDGVATTIAVLDLDTDSAAFIEAVQLLEEHASARSVEIWQASRRVLACVRANDYAPSKFA